MPIVIELVVLLLLAYAIGMAVGWGIWGRSNDTDLADD